LSKASDAHELSVKDSINKMNISGLKAERPPGDVKYSDIKLTYKKGKNTSKTAWVEVKMNHTDNLGNIRVSWDGTKWAASEKGGVTPLKAFMSNLLNSGRGKSQADKFLNDLAKFVGAKSKNKIKVPSTEGGLKDPAAVSPKQMQEFLKTRNSQYFIDVDNVDLGKLVTKHYNEGKAEPVAYMQAGNDFFMIGSLDTLGIKNKHHDIPFVKGKGMFRMRIGFRTKFYEVQPEIKIKTMGKSNYSLIDPEKKNPFDGL
jgi:hypothetical protein